MSRTSAALMTAVPTNMRLRGTNPAIEVTASNVSFLLGETAPGGVASMALRQGVTMPGSTAFLYVSSAPANPASSAPASASATPTAPLTAVCGTDVTALSFPGAAEASLVEPTVSLRTFADTERARITGAGLHCDRLTAAAFTNLVGDYVTQQALVPPSAAALAAAYVDLSNQIVKATVPGPAGAGAGAGADAGADAYGDLLDTYESTSVQSAPTANALRGAFLTLSNLMAVRFGAISDSLVSMVRSTSGNVMESITSGIAASAVRAAICNQQATTYDCDDEGENLVVNVYLTNATPSNQQQGSSSGGGGGSLVGVFSLTNDEYIRSTPDGEARFLFATSGPSTFASAGNGSNAADGLAFAWFVNDMQEDVMELTGRGALWVRSGLTVGGPTTLTGDAALLASATVGGSATIRGSATINGATTLSGPAVARSTLTVSGDATFLGDVALLGQTLTMGSDVQIRYSGSNLGINLPFDTEPVCALHVNGSVFSEEGLYELSDASVKTDIEPLTDALGKCMRIRGCSYQRTDIPLRQIGVIAQNVCTVVPEAVHVGSDGRMSVAYGNLVALAIEAIREVSENQRALVERLDRLEKGGEPPLNPPPEGGGG